MKHQTVVMFSLVVAASASAQEAMYTQAATMPGPGNVILREQIHYWRYGSDPVAGTSGKDKYELENTINIGLDRGLSLLLDVPVALTRATAPGLGASWDRGVEDIHAMFKYRVYMDNPSGVNTTRIAVMGGAAFASGDDREFSSQSVNPMVGAVYTTVAGRHGFNQDLIYRFNTGGTSGENDGGDGPDDALFFNTAYLYRIFPSSYTADSNGAWYLTAEMNGLYETNGDTELRWSPGLMYEGREFGFEIMAQFPLFHDLKERAEVDYAVGIGVRFLF